MRDSAGLSTSHTGTSGALRGPRARPALWRLPLLAFLAIGVVCLKYLDGRLSSDYRKSAADLAVQADALIERAIGHRAEAVHTLQSLIAAAPSSAEEHARLDVFGRSTVDSSGGILWLYRLDERGDVRETYPNEPSPGDLSAENHLLLPETAEAMARARETAAPAATGVMVLRDDTLGFVIYDAIVTNGRVNGYVAAAIAYGPMLRSLLTARLQDRFGYRITDSLGRVLAVSPRYPSRASEFATQLVQLPGGQRWTLDVPIGLFQPRTARMAMWIVGAVLLFIVLLLVLREDARAERIAMHSFNLELLSRDLLDANLRIEERAQQVTEANMAKSRFLANVSHELRTPLNAIVGYNALALSGLYGEITSELRAAHDRIRTSAEHLLRVVNDVLDLSKIEVGRMEVELHPLAIEPLLDGVVAIVEPVAEAKNVRVDLVIARDLPQVVSDARHVRQILLNLASNAIKFTEHGSVTLVAKRGDGEQAGMLLIAVEDTGIGIATGDLARIFDEFEQVRPSGRGDSIERGTGLGLAVSRKLARLLGGDVLVDSQPGMGSRFTLALPIAPPPAESSRPAGAKAGDAEPTAPRTAEVPSMHVEAGPRP